MRVATVHRTRMTGLGAGWQAKLVLQLLTITGAFSVGDWVLVEPATRSLVRRLDRRAVLARHIEWSSVPQLAAANVDTLFIGTSRNADFNLDRLERCLAMANEGGLSRRSCSPRPMPRRPPSAASARPRRCSAGSSC